MYNDIALEVLLTVQVQTHDIKRYSDIRNNDKAALCEDMRPIDFPLDHACEDDELQRSQSQSFPSEKSYQRYL